MKNNKYLSLIKTTSIFAIGILGAKFVQFLLLPYFTNILTTEEYGTIDLIITFASLIVPIVTFNLADAILRFGLSPDIKKKDVLNNALFILIISTVLTMVLYPLLHLYRPFSKWKIYIALIIITQSIRLNFSLYIKANEKLVTYSMDSILYAFAVAGFDIILMSYYKMGIKGYIIAEIAGSCISILFLVFKGNIFKNFRLERTLDFQLMKNMMKYSIPLMFNAISWWITNFSDRIILNLFRTESDVGLYSVAAKMPAIITTGLSVFTQAWIMSSIVEYDTNKDIGFFKKVYLYYHAFLSVVISLVIILIEPFMKVYIGNDFKQAWQYVPYLLIGTLYLGISNFYGAFYSAAKENLKEVRSTIICAASNILLNFCLIPRYGILGAVFATMLSYIIIVFVRIYDTKKILNMDINIFVLLANMVAICLEAVFIVVYRNYLTAIGIIFFILLLNGVPILKDLKNHKTRKG